MQGHGQQDSLYACVEEKIIRSLSSVKYPQVVRPLPVDTGDMTAGSLTGILNIWSQSQGV